LAVRGTFGADASGGADVSAGRGALPSPQAVTATSRNGRMRSRVTRRSTIPSAAKNPRMPGSKPCAIGREVLLYAMDVAFERGRMAQRECSVVVRREDDDEELYFSPSKKMVGERSPDSVLFRLEDLQAAAEASGPPPLRLSNTAPGGGSGLIDLRELVPVS